MNCGCGGNIFYIKLAFIMECGGIPWVNLGLAISLLV